MATSAGTQKSDALKRARVVAAGVGGGAVVGAGASAFAGWGGLCLALVVLAGIALLAAVLFSPRTEPFDRLLRLLNACECWRRR